MKETSISFKSKINPAILKAIIPEKEPNSFCLGVDYGDRDIHILGVFELMPNIVKFKRKKKGKRYIIKDFNVSMCLKKIGDKQWNNYQ